jgi:hypothetical protein
MASGDDKQEEEEFEDLPSDVEGDASEVGNTSAQEKFDKLKKAVKESSKDNGKKEDKKKEKEEEKKKRRKRTASKKRRRKGRKKKRREEREHLRHHHHHPHHHLHLVRMEMGMTSTMAQEFPREHSSLSQSPRLSPRMTIEAYPLTMILWKQNLRMISLYPLANYPNLMGLTLLNGSI